MIQERNNGETRSRAVKSDKSNIHFLDHCLATGIFGWVLEIFILLTSFTHLSTYFSFGRLAGLFLIISPGLSWLIAIIIGNIGGGQIKRKGHQEGNRLGKLGIVLSGIGCALFYGLL